MSRKILIVEDDAHIRLGLFDALSAEGYEVIECASGRPAVGLVRQHGPALVVLDVMLPERNGFDVCRDLRAADLNVPVLFLTAKGQEVDKVIGLELGADDYMTKPFGVRELLARVHALIRRSSGSGTPSAPEEIRLGDATVRPESLRGKTGNGAEIELTPRELAVLVLLNHHRGDAVSRERILNEVWGVKYLGTTRTLDQLIVKLRQKVEVDPAKPRYLRTVHGLGYRLEK